jgi:alanine-synthesizing transaminase
LHVQQAERIGRLKYAIRNIASAALALEAEGRQVLYLNIGDPLLYDFETPAELVEAVARAMREGKNYYAPSYGLPQAREAIAASLEREGVEVAPGNVFVTTGASEGIEVAMTAMLEPGDNVLTPVPGYPLYSAILTKLHADERGYRLDPFRGWRPDLEHAESLIDSRTRAIVVINPNNPTGAVWERDALEAVVELARRRKLVILADEVYHTLTYGERPPRLAAIAGDVPVIAFDSLSKSYLATGWRLGWMSLHGDGLHAAVKGAICRLLDARLCSPTPSQFAIPVAVAGERTHLRPALAKLQERRDALMRGLWGIPGVYCNCPEGAFYAMAKFDGIGEATDEDFVLDVLNSTGILVVHGSGFGLPPRDGFFRIVYLPPVPVIEQACRGLASVAKRWLERRAVLV